MSGGLIYVSQQSSQGLGTGTGPQVAGNELTAQATARFGGAVEGFGDALAKASAQVQKINVENDVLRRQTAFSTQLDELGQKYLNDPDPSTSAQRYAEDVKRIRNEQLTGVDPMQRAWLENRFNEKSISYVSDQRVKALSKQADRYTADLDAQYQSLTGRYASAKSDAERQSAQAELDGLLNTGTTNGRITFKQAEGYRQSLTKTGDEALALRAIGQNPGTALAALSDPAQFAGMDPVRKQQLVEQARAARDEVEVQRRAQAARMDPTIAPVLGGRVQSDEQGAMVYNRVLRGQGGTEAFAMRHLMARGFTQAQAAGIVGNLVTESRLNTGAVNPGDGADGTNSVGIAQWNSGRAVNLQVFAKARGKPVSDLETQLDFVIHELNTSEGAAGAKLRAAQTPEQAAAAFIGFERPKGWSEANPTGGMHWDKRRGHAMRLAGSSPEDARPDGQAAFAGHLKAFNGQIAPAIAAYYGAPADALKQAHEAAVAKFGDGYSPAQFVEVLPASVNADIRSKLRAAYDRMKVPMDAPALSPAASYRLSGMLTTVADQEKARQDQLLSRITRLAGAEADQVVPMLKDGLTPDPQRVAGMRSSLELAATRGDATAAEKLRTLDEALVVQPMVAQMYRMRPEQIESDLGAMRQKVLGGIATPEDYRRFKVLEKVHGEISSARKSDPIGLAERAGITAPTAVSAQVDFNDPAQVGQFAAQIAARAVASDRSNVAYGTRQFFRPDEKAALQQRWNDMGDNDRFRMMEQIARNSHSEGATRAALTELTGGNGHAATAGMFMTKNPEVARAIMTGAGYLEQPGVKPKVDDIKKGIATAFGGDMFPPAIQAQLTDAALAVYASERGKNGALYDPQDSSGIEKAVERVIGRVEKINGRRVPIPSDIAGWQVRQAFERITPDAFDAAGGTYGAGGQKLDPRFVGRNAQLVPMGVGDGKFAVVLPGANGNSRPVLTRDNGPLIIDLGEFVKGVRVGQAQTPGQARNAALADYARRGNDGREVQP